MGLVDEGSGVAGGGQHPGGAVPGEDLLVLHHPGEEGSGVSSRPVSLLTYLREYTYLLHPIKGLYLREYKCILLLGIYILVLFTQCFSCAEKVKNKISIHRGSEESTDFYLGCKNQLKNTCVMHMFLCYLLPFSRKVNYLRNKIKN